MSAAQEFEECVSAIGASAEQAAKRALDPNLDLPVPELTPGGVGSRSEDLLLALRLTRDELELVWSVVARAFEPRIAAHARETFGPEARLGVSLAHHIAWRQLSVERSRGLLAVLDSRHPLRTSGILFPIGSEPLDVSTPWTTSYRIARFLRGDDAIEPEVAAVGGVLEVGRVIHSGAQRTVLQKLRAWLTSPNAATIIVEGAYGSGRRTAIAHASNGRRVIAVDMSRVAPRNAEALLTAIRREAVLLDAIPVLANLDDMWTRLPTDDEIKSALVNALDAIDGPLVITTSTALLELRPVKRMLVRARWPLPDAPTRRALWIDAIGEKPADHDLDTVAHRYELGAGGILAAARSGVHHAEQRGSSLPSFEDLVVGVQDNIAERLGELAKRVTVTQEWSELVLTPDTQDDVRALIGRIRNAHAVLDGWGFRRKLARGAGVAALFSGPPGTGKTMVAGLIARELQLELYQVDLSRIVSKWIGETEKQLAKVFEAAEAGHALLLFDEADSLFAKRSAEVKSAVDRYANLEVNYLLQRVESFGGVVILTTNLDASIDPAMRRRLASHIVFGTPELDERQQLWRRMLDTGAPLEGVIEYRALADEFRDMTGANIRNATLTAAFLAAEERTGISMSQLRRAARSEYRAMGHLLTKDHESGLR